MTNTNLQIIRAIIKLLEALDLPGPAAGSIDAARSSLRVATIYLDQNRGR